MVKEQMLNKKRRVGVWGLGYIGFSSMASLALKGVNCIGTDIRKEVVHKVNNGQSPVKDMEYWLGFDVRPLVNKGLVKATLNWRNLITKDVPVHLVCVPTEKNGKPDCSALCDVLMKLSKFKYITTKSVPLVIIESTLAPGTTDKLVIPTFRRNGLRVGKDILVGIAPRRDWFISPEKNLKTLPRIVGGTTKETTKAMKNVLSIVCDNLLPATDHKHAELVKSIENTFRHVDITLANQLAIAYPGVNIKEVLELVGTKWNIETYYPSFGTGGSCIPLSTKYVLEGVKNPEKLSILSKTIEADEAQPMLIVKSILKRSPKKVGILGLAYKGNLKVHTLSPTIKIVKYLQNNKIKVKVHDPLYTKSEIKHIVNAETFDFPNDLKEFDTILITSDHHIYQYTPQEEIIKNLKNCKVIMDNIGVWEDIKFKKIKYYRVGYIGWL